MGLLDGRTFDLLWLHCDIDCEYHGGYKRVYVRDLKVGYEVSIACTWPNEDVDWLAENVPLEMDASGEDYPPSVLPDVALINVVDSQRIVGTLLEHLRRGGRAEDWHPKSPRNG